MPNLRSTRAGWVFGRVAPGPERNRRSLSIMRQRLHLHHCQGTPCLSSDPIANVATPTCQRTPPMHASARSSAPSARLAPMQCCTASAPIAAVNWCRGHGVLRTSWPVIQPPLSASTSLQAARNRLRPYGTYLACSPRVFRFGGRSMHGTGTTAKENMRESASAGIRGPGCSAPCPPPCGLPLDLRRTPRQPDPQEAWVVGPREKKPFAAAGGSPAPQRRTKASTGSQRTMFS